MKVRGGHPSKNLLVDESERRALLLVDADSKKCQSCVVEMAKKNRCTLAIIYSINLRGCHNFSGSGVILYFYYFGV
jgi:hypothetical protein